MKNKMKSSVNNSKVLVGDELPTDIKHKRRSSRIKNAECGSTDSPLNSTSESKYNNVSEKSFGKVEDNLCCHLPDQSSRIFEFESENGIEKDFVKQPHLKMCDSFDDRFEQISTINQSAILTKNADHKEEHFLKKYSYAKAKLPEVQVNNVSKVFKIVSTPSLKHPSINLNNAPKSSLKTYAKSRKSLKKSAVVETFGLPDSSIIPDEPLISNVLDAETLDAKEITLQDLQFVQEPWCILDLEEHISALQEIRIKADPQKKHMKICYSSNAVSNDFDLYNQSPMKLQTNIDSISPVGNVKNLFDETKLNVQKNKRSFNKKSFNQTGKTEVIIEDNSLTLEDREVEIFKSDAFCNPSDTNSTTVITNKISPVNNKTESKLGNSNERKIQRDTSPRKKNVFERSRNNNKNKKDVNHENKTVTSTIDKKRTLRSFSIAADSIPSYFASPNETNLSERLRSSSKNEKHSSQPEIKIECDDAFSIPKRILRSSSCPTLPEDIEINNVKAGKSPNALKSFCTKKPSIVPEVPSLSGKKKVNNKVKIALAVTPKKNTKQLKVILHPLRKLSYKLTKSPKREKKMEIDRTNKRFNSFTEKRTKENAEKSANSSAPCEMLLELVDIIPISDKPKDSKLLQSKPFFNLFKNTDDPLKPTFLNKNKKSIKLTRKSESKIILEKTPKSDKVEKSAESTSANLGNCKETSGNITKEKNNLVCQINTELKLKSAENSIEGINETSEYLKSENTKSSIDISPPSEICDKIDDKHTKQDDINDESSYVTNISPSLRKTNNKLKILPEANAETTKSKHVIKRINKSDERKCKVVINKELKECLEVRQYNRKSQCLDINFMDPSEELKDKDDIPKNKANKNVNQSKGSVSRYNNNSPIDKLSSKTWTIIKMPSEEKRDTIFAESQTRLLSKDNFNDKHTGNSENTIFEAIDNDNILQTSKSSKYNSSNTYIPFTSTPNKTIEHQSIIQMKNHWSNQFFQSKVEDSNLVIGKYGIDTEVGISTLENCQKERLPDQEENGEDGTAKHTVIVNEESNNSNMLNDSPDDEVKNSENGLPSKRITHDLKKQIGINKEKEFVIDNNEPQKSEIFEHLNVQIDVKTVESNDTCVEQDNLQNIVSNFSLSTNDSLIETTIPNKDKPIKLIKDTINLVENNSPIKHAKRRPSENLSIESTFENIIISEDVNEVSMIKSFSDKKIYENKCFEKKNLQKGSHFDNLKDDSMTKIISSNETIKSLKKLDDTARLVKKESPEIIWERKRKKTLKNTFDVNKANNLLKLSAMGNNLVSKELNDDEMINVLAFEPRIEDNFLTENPISISKNSLEEQSKESSIINEEMQCVDSTNQNMFRQKCNGSINLEKDSTNIQLDRNILKNTESFKKLNRCLVKTEPVLSLDTVEGFNLVTESVSSENQDQLRKILDKSNKLNENIPKISDIGDKTRKCIQTSKEDYAKINLNDTSNNDEINLSKVDVKKCSDFANSISENIENADVTKTVEQNILIKNNNIFNENEIIKNSIIDLNLKSNEASNNDNISNILKHRTSIQLIKGESVLSNCTINKMNEFIKSELIIKDSVIVNNVSYMENEARSAKSDLKMLKVSKHCNSLDEEVSTINGLINTDSLSSLSCKKQTSPSTKNAFSEGLNDNEKSPNKFRSKTSLGERKNSRFENDLGTDQTKYISVKPRSKTSLDDKINNHDVSNKQLDDENQKTPKMRTPKTRSKSNIGRKISSSAEESPSSRTRSKTSLGENITKKNLKEFFTQNTDSDNFGVENESISIVTRSKTSLGEKIKGCNNDEPDKPFKVTRSKTSLGERIHVDELKSAESHKITRHKNSLLRLSTGDNKIEKRYTRRTKSDNISQDRYQMSREVIDTETISPTNRITDMTSLLVTTQKGNKDFKKYRLGLSNNVFKVQPKDRSNEIATAESTSAESTKAIIKVEEIQTESNFESNLNNSKVEPKDRSNETTTAKSTIAGSTKAIIKVEEIQTKSNLESNLNNSKVQPKERSNEIATAKSNSAGSTRAIIKVEEIQTKKIYIPKLGDIVWTRIGKHPFWPSFISEENTTGVFMKSVKKRFGESMMYHVRFFGDKGRRAWISGKKIMEYTSKDDLEKVYNILKSSKNVIELNAYLVRPNVKQKWLAAVEEVEFVKSQDFNYEQKIEYLETINKYEIGMSELKDTNSKGVKLNATEETSSKNKTNRLSKKHKYSEILDDLREINQGEHPKKKLKLTVKDPSSTARSPKRNVSKDANLSETSLVDPTPTVKKELNIEESFTYSDDASEEIVIKNEYSDTEFKISLNTLKNFGSYTTGEQKALFKRNNLFKGVSKEKVCHYCFEFGDILKCKGGCNGIYHPYCAAQVLKQKYYKRKKNRNSYSKRDKVDMNKVKQETVTSSGNQSEVDESHVQIVTIPSSIYNTPPRKTFPPDFENMSLGERIDFKMKEIMKKFESTSYSDNLIESTEENGIVSPQMKTSFSSKCQDLFSVGVQRSPQQNQELDKELDAMLNNGLPVIPYSPKSDVDSTTMQSNFKHVTADSPSPARVVQVSHPDSMIQESSSDSKTNSPIAHVTADTEEVITKNTLNNKKVSKNSPKYKRSLTKHVTADSPQSIGSYSENKNVNFTNVPLETKMFNNYRKSLSKQNTGESFSTETEDSESLRSSLSRQSKQSELNENFDAFKNINPKNFECGFCVENIDPYCFICNEIVSKKGSNIRHKCSMNKCAKFYHQECLKLWPQTQWSLIQTTKNRYSREKVDSFVCPQHVCHTCASDNPRAAYSRCSWDKIVKCVCCPASYHSSNLCVPAGTEILTSTQIVCPRHRSKSDTRPYTINTTWCLLCNQGGNLICCETCPTSVHPECMTVSLTDDDRFICEDCESGRLPLYDEVVWVKLGKFRWWPCLIIFPNEVPIKVLNTKHSAGDFVVKFFGTYDYYWMNRGRAFLFEEGDTLDAGVNSKKKVEASFIKAVEEAVIAHKMKKQFKLTQMAESANSMKPPPYIKIKVSKPVGNVRLMELNLSNITACDCDPCQLNPCGPDSNCLNRLLMTECNPEVCPAGKHCKNQSFEKREYPTLIPYKTETRGWGLKTLEPIYKGQFVIEYVGELIDDEEYQRRLLKMHEQKDENYYFLTIHKDRMIDAGPKGNMARFMNHCCQPNCETQKWTVNGDTRVGLFATEDIPVDTELTFNYNLECTGTEKKICRCGAPNCSGFIGVKAKIELAEPKKPRKERKKKAPETPVVLPPCFICQKVGGNINLCNNKICNNTYHLRCLRLTEWPKGKKFVCPWHYCNTCSKRTIRCCVKCLNSFCPSHSEGNVRYDNLMGFVCSLHDPNNSNSETSNTPAKKKKLSTLDEVIEAVVMYTTNDVHEDIDDLSLLQRHQILMKSKRKVYNSDVDVKELCTLSQVKNKDDESQNESDTSTDSDFEKDQRPKRKRKQKRTKNFKSKSPNVFNKTTTATCVNDSDNSHTVR